MNDLLYKNREPLHPAVQAILSLICMAAYSVCCLPPFRLIGHFAMQIFLSVLFSFLCTVVFFFALPRSLPILANGLSAYLLLFLGIALYKQLTAQLAAESFSGWIYIFFYDKPTIVSAVWGTAFVMILFLRLFLPLSGTSESLRKDFVFFFKRASTYFLFFYCCILVYCFLLQRSPGTDFGFNLIPFSMILSYIRSASYAYESLFYLLGNVLCLFPFGFYYRIRKPDADFFKTLLLPVILSLLIEVSQILFRMGDFDVDDILMNAAGFYLGYFISFLFDKIRFAITKGEERTIFIP